MRWSRIRERVRRPSPPSEAKDAIVKAKEADAKSKEVDPKAKDALATQPSKKEDPHSPKAKV